jgi:hypothetical protein
MIFFFDEEVMRRDLRKAYEALTAARTLQIKGVQVPSDIFDKIEGVIEKLEKRLVNLAYDGEDD